MPKDSTAISRFKGKASAQAGIYDIEIFAALIRHEETALVKRNIAGALARLNDREAYIIQHRVMSEDPETLQEIGDRFKLTKERIRQIEKSALKRLTHPSRSELLESYVA